MGKKKMHCILAGIYGGLVNGLLGTGGGIVLNLIYMHRLKMEQKQSMSTALFIMPVFSVVSIIGLWGTVNIDWISASLIIVGGIAGAVIGGRIFKKISIICLKRIFALFLIWAGVRGVFF